MDEKMWYEEPSKFFLDVFSFYQKQLCKKGEKAEIRGSILYNLPDPENNFRFIYEDGVSSRCYQLTYHPQGNAPWVDECGYLPVKHDDREFCEFLTKLCERVVLNYNYFYKDKIIKSKIEEKIAIFEKREEVYKETIKKLQEQIDGEVKKVKFYQRFIKEWEGYCGS